jgi:superfamily II DNA or RNA helicase
MARRVTVVCAGVLRSILAESALGTAPSPHLGTITLRRHQLAAITRIEAAVNAFGGALLADAVGLGKTYVALAVARGYRRTLVIAPAVLRPQWEHSGRASGTALLFASTESLSHGPVEAVPDLVIVDEAHHFRNPTTRRYARLADLTATTPVLLLSATPIHNRREDLIALVALFLGSRAAELSVEQLASCVIRREQSDVPGVGFPAVARARRILIPAAEEVLDRICGLPPPVPLAGGRAAAALVRNGLAQSWASSDAALLSTITRRLTRGEALHESVRSGRLPTQRELATWLAGDDTIQLGFPELLCARDADSGPGFERSIVEHLDALRDLARVVRTGGSRDRTRIDALQSIRATHPGERIVVFTTFASTARRMYEALERSGGAALVTGRGARIASGALPTHEVLRIFRSPTHRREAIELLLATDLLSEGLDLPEATVIVHMDFPWTPARLEQRLGRLRRPRASGAAIVNYLFVQPASIEKRLRRERLLARKAMTSTRLIGTGSAPMRWEALHRMLDGWLTSGGPRDAPRERCVTVAACSAPAPGALALIQSEGRTVLLAVRGKAGRGFHTSVAPQELLRTVRAASATDSAFTSQDYLAVRRALDRRIRLERVRRLTALDPSLPRGIMELTGRLGSLLGLLPIHHRARLAPRVTRLRMLLADRLTAGLERRLGMAANATDTPDEIIERFERILGKRVPRDRRATDELRAVLLLVPGSSK